MKEVNYVINFKIDDDIVIRECNFMLGITNGDWKSKVLVTKDRADYYLNRGYKLCTVFECVDSLIIIHSELAGLRTQDMFLEDIGIMLKEMFMNKGKLATYVYKSDYYEMQCTKLEPMKYVIEVSRRKGMPIAYLYKSDYFNN